MVPIRFVSEAMGAEVKWNAASQSVIISLAQQLIPTSNESELGVEENIGKPASPLTSSILRKISGDISKASDIVFVVDVTSSMSGVLDYVRQTVKEFVESVPSGSNFAVVAFRDIYSLGDKDLEAFDFTADKNKLKGNLDTLRASGGGDLNESGLEAVNLALTKLSNRANSKRIIFITDAPVHDKTAEPNRSKFSVDEINEQLQKNHVIFNAIAPTDGLAYEQLKKLVDSNKGTLYNIHDANLNLPK
jgi:Mg-chelatase subunit ChlD